MVPTEVTRAVLDDELPPAVALAERRGGRIDIDLDALAVRVHMIHPADQAPLLLGGEFTGYRALPPAWVFLDPATGQPARAANPAPGSGMGQSSIFHSNGFICAHWSRMAYGELGGPHGGWGAASGWVNVKEGTQAHTVAEMLSTVYVHLRHSPGRLS